MKLQLIQIVLIVAIVSSNGCTINPKPIQYGIDNCNFCEMTIIDNKHSSELVTDKGKVYKFDAIECMVRYVSSYPKQIFTFILIADLSSPGKLINARNGFYLISENLPSPMGDNLSGFSTKTIAIEYQNNYGGKIYSWQEINTHISNI